MSPPLSHFTAGDGPRATVLLHGFLGSGKNLRTLALRWSERDPTRRFLVPDLNGHGTSPPVPAPGAGLDDLARAVLATLDAADVPGPVSFVGHSLGGRVALAALRIAPQRASDVALLDIAPGPLDPATSESRAVLDVLLAAPDGAPDRRTLRAFLVGRGLSPALADWLLMNVETRDGGCVWRFDRTALGALHERVSRDDLWPVVTGGRVPIRCIYGGRSRYVTATDVQRLEAAGCTVDVLPDAGHFVHVDALDGLLELLA